MLEAAPSSKPDKPESYPERFSVPDAYKNWNVDYPTYNPPYYVDTAVLTRGVERGWAEPEDFSLVPKRTWSKSYNIETSEKGIPLNPMGRTGIEGRGLLGKWGANYAVDVLISRNTSEGREFLLIKRDDNHMYAFVGGMVDGNEEDVTAAERELSEEASLELDLHNAAILYKGYGDDYRNTDNAWIESTLFYIESNDELIPVANDDAEAVIWVHERDIKNIEMHSNHKELLLTVLNHDRD